MAELRPTGAVTAVSGTPAIVGSAPWGDDDDASYVVLTQRDTLTTSFPKDAVTTPLPAFTGEAADVAEVWLRVKVAPEASGDLLALTVEVDSPIGDFWLFGNLADTQFFRLTADGVTREVRGTVTLGDPATLLAALAGGGCTLYVDATYVGTMTTDPPPSVVTIYEIGWGTPDVEEVLVTRLWPRDDGYGLGSAHRIYPPPRRSRIVGGQS
jgi:hypothetical protein